MYRKGAIKPYIAFYDNFVTVEISVAGRIKLVADISEYIFK